MTEEISFREGLFVIEDGESFLLGNRCVECDQLYFPAKPYCFECRSERLVQEKFGQKGRLYSYTVSHLPSERFKPPYTAGWIDCSEGVRVFAPLSFSEGISPQIGMDLELTIKAMWLEGKRHITGYMYRPMVP